MQKKERNILIIFTTSNIAKIIINKNIDKYSKTFRVSTYTEFAILPCYEYTKPYQSHTIMNWALKYKMFFGYLGNVGNLNEQNMKKMLLF